VISSDLAQPLRCGSGRGLVGAAAGGIIGAKFARDPGNCAGYAVIERGAVSRCGVLFPPVHSITSSARTRNDSGIVRPSAFAVLRLITNSNFVGCCTGRSAGFAPLRILST
jgi:hypothetical protein